jgi:hypothetical protein
MNWILIILIASFSLPLIDAANKLPIKKTFEDGVIMCIEQPKQCKTVYDYLKLKDSSNETTKQRN